MQGEELKEGLRGSLAIVERRSAALEVAQSAPLNPMQELQLKIVRSGDLEQLRELRAIAKEWRDDDAKQQFIAAMAAFKQEPEVVQIVKDKKNKQYGDSPYVSLGKEASVIVPLLAKHGMSSDWDIEQNEKGGITVSCIITHKAGHSKKPVRITLPPDASGSKNAAQQVKSAITYGRIITLECACGIAPIDSIAHLNDDGNAAGGKQSEGAAMDENAVRDYLSAFDAATTHEELQREYLKAQDAATRAGDTKAATAFADAKNRRLIQMAKQQGGRK